MGKLFKLVAVLAFLAPLSACQSFSLDKDRAAEQRKQELCGDISTRNLPHCSGVGTDISAVSTELQQQTEKTGLLADVAKTVMDDALKQDPASDKD